MTVYVNRQPGVTPDVSLCYHNIASQPSWLLLLSVEGVRLTDTTHGISDDFSVRSSFVSIITYDIVLCPA